MAHRRAASRRGSWDLWLLVPVALALDVAAALGLAGQTLPMGVIVPDAVLLTAPILVYGALVFLVLPTWSLGSRLAAVAALLGIHAGLVALHSLVYIVLRSMPAPAALRLAYRWSPLIPLLQLVWVPLLASPLATLVRSRPRRAAARRIPVPVPVEVLLSRASQAAARRGTSPDREVQVDTGSPGVAPVVEAEAVPGVEPEPGPSASAPVVLLPTVGKIVDEGNLTLPPAPTPGGEAPASVPRPTWPKDIVETSAHAGPAALPSAEAVGGARGGDEPAAISVAVDLTTDGEAEAAASRAREVGRPETETAVEDEPRTADAALAMETAAPRVPATEFTPRAMEPPFNLDLVTRAFEPYGPLLSRDRLVAVDWTPGPDVAIVCVAPRDISRDRVVHLAARLVRVLEATEVRSTPGPIRRLSLRGPDGVVVLTPLEGAVLVAATHRRGALALLEVLSARVVPDGGGSAAAAQASDAAPAAVVDTPVAGAVRVETPGAILDVLAPAGIAVAPFGQLAGRLLAAIAADGGGPGVFDTLSVNLGTHRLMVHPVKPLARPPRFVAVVGGTERPGLLGRRAERAARALRAAS